jgi:hypothetical protein
MTVHFAAEIPGVGVCVVSDTAVSMSKDGAHRQRVDTHQKAFFTNSDTGVVVVAAGEGALCRNLLLGLAESEQRVGSPSSAADWRQKTVHPCQMDITHRSLWLVAILKNQVNSKSRF